MKKYNKIFIFVMLMAILATCFVGCVPSDEKLIGKINAAFSGANAIDLALGEYTLPAVNKELTKNGVTFDIKVKDVYGQDVSVNNGKFNVAVGGEYEITVVAKNKKGKTVIEKNFRVTENAALSAKLTGEEVAELVAKKNDVMTRNFAKFNLNYVKFLNLSCQDKELISQEGSFIVMLDTILSDSILSSGLSKQSWIVILEKVDAFFTLLTVETDIDKDEVVNLVKNLFDNVLAPIFNGAESPIAIAAIIYEASLNYAKDSLEKNQMAFEMQKSTYEANVAAQAMTDERIITLLKGIKASVETEMQEVLLSISNISEDIERASAIYNVFASYKIVPALGEEELTAFLADNAVLLGELLDIIGDNNKLFYSLSGARLFANEQFKPILRNDYNYYNYITNAAIDSLVDYNMSDAMYINSRYAITQIEQHALLVFDGLKDADAESLNDYIVPFKVGIQTIFSSSSAVIIDSGSLIRHTEDLADQKAALDEMIINKAAMIDEYSFLAKVSSILSPIINSNYGKELIIWQACAAMEIEYIPTFMDPTTGEWDINTADMSAILTSVDGQLGKFMNKYDAHLGNLDNTLLHDIGEKILENINNEIEADEDKLTANTISDLTTKYIKLIKPVLTSAREIIGMLNNDTTIDYFKGYLTVSESNPPSPELLSLNKSLAISVIVKNVINSSKADLTIDAYLSAIKADIIADTELSALVNVETVDAYIQNIKDIYTLSLDTLNSTDSMFLIAEPTDPDDYLIYKAEIDALLGRWNAIFGG